MEDNKASKALKESDITNIEYKMYLCLGADPDHDCKVIDITESIPDELIEEYYASDSTYERISDAIIGVKEVIKTPKIDGGCEISLANPLGIHVSIQQKINNVLQAAIVNERQYRAISSLVDDVFKQCEFERGLSVKNCVRKNLL